MSRRASGQLGRKHAGLSLIELMVAMAVALFMLTGVISLVVSMSRARAELDKSSEHIENGRYAIQRITEDIRLAGFFGAGQLIPEIYSTPDPCATSFGATELGHDPITSATTLPVPVQAWQVGYTAPSCFTDVLDGGAAITLHRVATDALATATAGTVYLQHSSCNDDSATVAIGTSGFSLKGKDCTTAAPLWRFITRSYYVAECDSCGDDGDDIPTLKMAEFNGASVNVVSVAQGIEDLNFDYGFDLNGDGTTDCYAADPAAAVAPASCPAGWVEGNEIANASNIASVRISVLVRSVEPTPGWTDDRTYDLGRADRLGPFNDAFKRRIYSTVIMVPNVAGVRE